MDLAHSVATTVHIRDHCLCLHVQRAARTLARRFDEAFRPLGLTSGQFSLLNALNRPAPPTIGDVADLLGMDRTTLTAALKPLVDRGRVAVEPDAGDKRIRRLRLTDDGASVLAQAKPIWIAMHDRIEHELPPAFAGDDLRLCLDVLAGFETPTRPAANAA
jgi:DNA-binding MarR family transcriptional regulator